MKKRLNNLKLSLASFHFCRTKRADAIAPAAAYRLSPFNPKACDINYPKLPAPPPTTPEPDRRPPVGSGRKVAPVDYCRSSSDCSSDSLEFAVKSHNYNYMTKIAENQKEAKTASWRKGGRNGAVVAPCWEEEAEAEEEEYDGRESLPFSSRSFSFEDSSEGEGGIGIGKEVERMKDLRREVLAGWKADSAAPKAEFGGSMGEAMAVVKNSSDPKGDFKRSMMEMIAEKGIYEAKELEELLQCLLSLNSRQYHGHIVEAFSEVWEEIFS